MEVDPDSIRLIEAVLFASTEPLGDDELAGRLEGGDIIPVLAVLRDHYAERGVQLIRVAGKWTFRTAPDLAGRLAVERTSPRKPSRATLETLAVVAYHQPVTRAEIEEIRGVSVSRGTLDILLEAGWVAPGRRRRTPGRPLTWVTTETFLVHFGLENLDELPGLDEMRAAGLLDARSATAVVREDAMRAAGQIELPLAGGAGARAPPAPDDPE